MVKPPASRAAELDRATRRAQVIAALADAVAMIERAAPLRVAVDGLTGTAAGALADELSHVLVARGRRCRRASLDAFGYLYGHGAAAPNPAALRSYGSDDLVVVDGSFLHNAELVGAWDLVIFLRGDGADHDPDRARAAVRYLTEVDPEHTADIVVDVHDPTWPVIRRIDPAIADRLGRDLHPAETRAFFAPRAATWEQHFPDDDPAYAAAVAELGLRAGQTALDPGCGTGRALPHLHRAVSPGGNVVGLDLTPEMLAAARSHDRHAYAWLVLADARRLPLRTGGIDAAFAAGLLPHLPEPAHGLVELARVVRPGGRLCLFHPSGRVALAARHGRQVRDNDLLAERTLRRLLDQTGWLLDRYDDPPDRFLAIATRTDQPVAATRPERPPAVGQLLGPAEGDAGACPLPPALLERPERVEADLGAVATVHLMKAAVNTSYGPPDVVRISEVAKPTAKDNEILVKVHATTVNRTDCGFRSAKPFFIRLFTGPIRPRLTILGNEFAGDVEAVGSGVTSFRVGDRVFGYSGSTFGAHAEYLAIPADGLLATMPANLTYEEAAPGTEGSHYALSLIRAAKIQRGHDVLVNGATGAIGSAAVQLLKSLGARVTATCATEHVQLVSGLGADRVIDYTAEDFTKDEQRYDVVLDAVGKSSFARCRRLLKPRGIYLSTDLGPLSQNPILALTTPFLPGKKVMFPIPKEDSEMGTYFKGLIESGAFKPLIDRRYPLDQIVDAYTYVETGQKIGNVVITVAP